jgi:hypothetical protein
VLPRTDAAQEDFRFTRKAEQDRRGEKETES